MLTSKSEWLLKVGASIWIRFFDKPVGAVYVIKYHDSYYKIVDYGTLEDGYFQREDPRCITPSDAYSEILTNLGLQSGLAEIKAKFAEELTESQISAAFNL